MREKLELTTAQKQAIFSEVGTIIKAGAGSGKTFVIVEYIVVQLRTILQSSDILTKEIKQQVEKIAVITFTEKAAHELQERIENRLKEEYPEHHDFVGELLKHLFIGTIHSLCFQLLSSLNILGGSRQIGSQNEVNTKMNDLLESSLVSHDFDDFTYRNRDLIEKGMAKVFDSPEQRLNWETAKTQLEPISFFKEIFVKSVVPRVRTKSIVNTGKKWQEHFEKFLEIVHSPQTDVEKYERLSHLSQSISRLVGPKEKDVTYLEYEDFEVFKEIREKIKGSSKIKYSFDEALSEYEANYKETIEPFLISLKTVFEDMSKDYYSDDFISYSDLEYLVLKNYGRLSGRYEKLIVDEYQDLSWIQFDIIKNLLAADFNKLYAVGDYKQAIYSFRGGEVSVFKRTEKEVAQSVELDVNFRSLAGIANFNNALFGSLLDEYEPQNSFNNEIAEINLLTPTELAIREKGYSNLEINSIEADLIFQSIQTKISETQTESLAVLYKTRTPAMILIKKLLAANQWVETSFNIKASEEPLVTIFKELVAYLVDQNQNAKETCRFYLQAFLEFITEFPVTVQDVDLEEFKHAYEVEGLYLAYINFLLKFKILCSQYQSSLNFIEETCRYFNDQPFKVYQRIEQAKDENVSFELKTSSSKKIHIITSHASKGLEFDHVYIAGIWTNNQVKADRYTIGKNWGALTYKNKAGKKLITPQYLLEKEQQKLHDIDESKRLFYVACTRAIRSLNFVDLSGYCKLAPKSWAAFLFHHLPTKGFNTLKFSTDRPEFETFSTVQRPLFHQMDLSFRRSQHTNAIRLLPELSVTRFTQILDCPKKFYYAEILKLTDDDLEYVSEKFAASIKEQPTAKKTGISSSERGLEIHKKLENMIQGHDYASDQVTDYVGQLLENEKKSHKLSEHEIKFPFKGTMLTGTPDLVLVDDQKIEVWDFKTGLRSESAENKYRAQIAFYLHGLSYQLNRPDTKLVGKIVYLDLKEIVDCHFSVYSDVEDVLDELYSRINFYWKKNSDHCSQCNYRSICF